MRLLVTVLAAGFIFILVAEAVGDRYGAQARLRSYIKTDIVDEGGTFSGRFVEAPP